MMTFKLNTLSALVAAGMLLAAGAASAQTIVGGGATLPEPYYKASIFPNVPGNWSYTGTGSGAGKSAFLADNPQATSGREFRNETDAARPIWAISQSVHFAGSDSRLEPANVNAYNTTLRATLGPLIQVPVLVTPVTLPFQRAGVAAVNLTRDQVCKIFSYHPDARTWGQITGNGDATAIRVVYRSESSGTTELLSDFLANGCSGYGFVRGTVFTQVVAGAVAANGGLPAHWAAREGSSGVQNEVLANEGFAYLSPSYAFEPTNAAKVATIDGVLPSQATYAPAPPSGSAQNAPVNWVPAYSTPATGYPLVGTTNLLIGQCYKDGIGSGTVGASVKELLNYLINQNPGPDFIQLPLAWRNAITTAFLTQSNGLGIGNTSVCANIGRETF
ncbi:MAG: substrate-binding domain-containing protein [Rhodocyclaceae bacterium]